MKTIEDIIREILIRANVTSFDDIVNKTNVAKDEPVQKSNKTYFSEPILQKASQLLKSPNRITQMRKITVPYCSYSDYDGKLFYTQGKFMEDYEDDFEFENDFSVYYPTYQSLNDLQLRGFFSWRSKIRKGIFPKFITAFVYLYIYEILNNIGTLSPLDGYEKLQKIGEKYCADIPNLINYLSLWQKDYVLYYGLDTSLIHDESAKYREIIMSYKTASKSDLFSVLSRYSSYNFSNSTFYKTAPTDCQNVVCAVFDKLTVYYSTNHKTDLFHKIFGNKSTCEYYLFRSAIFYKKGSPKKSQTILSENDRYFLKNGTWFHYGYNNIFMKNPTISEMLRETDYLMRLAFSYPRKLKERYCTKACKDMIQKEITQLMQTKKITQKKATAPKIIINPKNFDKIRKAALEIQEKLIVECNMQDDPPCEQGQDASFTCKDYSFSSPCKADFEPKIAPAPDSNEASSVFSSSQKNFLSALIDRDLPAAMDAIKSQNVMASIFIDNLNERFFDEIGDNIIEFSNTTPVIIDDYLEDLKGML